MRLCIAVPALAVLLAACGLSGVGTLPGEPLDAGVQEAAPGPGVDGASSSDGASSGDSTPPLDAAASDAGPTCVPTGPEVCTDGIDNDCNQLTDCADPACTAGFACVPPQPAGWTLVAFDENDRTAACPSGYGVPSDVFEGATGAPATCTCGCPMTSSPTCDGIITGRTGQPLATCAQNVWQELGGPCVIVAQNPQGNAGIRITPAPASGGSCSNAVTKIVPPAAYAAQGRACSLATPAGGGCTGTDVCAPRPTVPFATCVSSTTAAACPAGYPTAHVVGTGTSDTRDCSACTCALSAVCENATFTFYSDTGCTTSTGHSFPADDVCHGTGQNSWNSYSHRYSATLVAGCSVAVAPAPSGGVALTGTESVCCQ